MRAAPVEFRRRRPLAWVGQGFLLVIAALAIYILAVNAVKEPSLFIQMLVSGLQLGFVYALIALGYTMVYGIVRLINFAHGDVFMVGSFVSYYAVARFRLHEWPAAVFAGFPRGLSVVIGSATVILLSMLVCVVLAVTIERVAYKPLRDAPRIAALITAIGISFFLEFFGALNFVFSPRFIPYERPFDVIAWYATGSTVSRVVQGQTPPTGSVTFSNILVIIMLASIAVQLVLQFLVRRTRIGVAMRATSFDKPTARLMGINVDRVISFTFATGAAFAGTRGRAVRHRLQLHLEPARDPSRSQGLRGRGPRRHRKHPRRIRRGPDHGPGRGAHHGLHLHAHARCRGVHHPHHRAPRAAHRDLRRARGREGLKHGARIPRWHDS